MFRRFPLCNQIGGKCNLVYRPLPILPYIIAIDWDLCTF